MKTGLVLAGLLLIVLSLGYCVEPVRLRPSGACTQPKTIGPCRAAFPRYYFDTTRRICLPFLYGGCSGNDNNFETEGACRSQCFRLMRRDTCKLPRRTGPCRARMTKYFYSRIAGRCQAFTYGGCRGNKNRFDTMEECTETCDT